MHRLKRIFTLSMSSGIAPRDERIIRICCSSPTAVPRDSWRESFLLDLSRKTNFNVCKKIAGKNASGSVSGKSDGQEELENSGKTYPEIIREYSEQIESKIARNEKKNRSSGIFSRMTIDRISSLTGMKKKDGGSSSDSSNSSGDATKKFEKYSDEGSEISVIIEPLPPDLHSNMSDMGIMMITVREKIASTHPFGVVDLRINGEPVTRVKQITRRFPNLNVTNSSGKCEIKIPITMSNKSVMNLSLSGPRRSESETDSSIRTTGRSSMSKIVPWWTTLESFRVLEIPRHLKIELQVSKNSPEEMKMPNNSEELSQVKVNSSPAEPGKSVTIFQSDKIINSWFNSNSKISPSHRFPETRLRYAPMKFIVPSIKNDKPIPKIGITRKSAIDSHSPGGKIMETGKTTRPITQGIDSLIDYKDRLPMEKNSERKLRQLEDSPEDQSRMPTEESIAEVIAKKSGARDGSLERIVKTRLKNPNTEPAKHPDDSERTTGPDASVKPIQRVNKLDSKVYTDELFSVMPRADPSGHIQASSGGNNQAALREPATPGKSGYQNTEKSTNRVSTKDDNILTPGTRSMRKLKMRLQRSVDRHTRNADKPSKNDRANCHVDFNQNADKKILYSAWLHSQGSPED